MMYSKPALRKKYRLRTTLVVPFVLQIVAAVGLVCYLSYQNGQQTVNDLVEQLQHEISSRVNERVQVYLDTPPLVNQINEDAVQLGILDFNNLENSKLYLWKQVIRFKSIGHVGLANEKGQYLRVGWVNRSVGSEKPQLAEQLKLGTGDLIYYKLDQNGTPIEVAKTTPNYNVRKRPFYTAVLKNNQAAWSNVYINFGYGSLQINASSPYYDSQGKLLGILTCQMGLDQIRGFLHTLKVGRSGQGQVFIIEPSGELIATSLTDQPLTVGKGEAQKRIKAQESGNLAMRRSMEYLKTHFKDLDNIQEATQLNFKLNSQRQFLEISPLRDKYGLNWLIVVVVPESDFMEQININTRNTILLCLGALGLAIAIGILTARWITRPIERITQASESMTQGNLEQHVKSSTIIELEKLAQAFNSMAGQLKNSFETLRQAEENYRSIFENALEGIFQSSPDGHLLSANPSMARIFGYDSSEEMIVSITDFRIQIYVNPTQQDEFRRLIQEEGQVKNFEFQAYRKDRSMTWVEMDARTVKDSNGQPLYYEGIMQDIAERKHQKEILEAMVKQRTAQLEAVNAEIAILNEKLKDENLRMGAELNILRQMQQLILPKPEELEIEGLDIAGFMEPADEVGGDYYDVLHTDGVVTISMGDVTGHGLESGILMLMTQTAVRILKEIREYNPVRFLDAINRTIYKNIQRMNSEKNLTLVILTYTDGKVSISGQHEETIVVRNGGNIERINTMDLGFPIGLDDNITNFINYTIIELQPGDGIVLYTDGITEAKNMAKQQYGIEQLCTVIAQNWHHSANEIKHAVIEDVRRFIEKQKVFDDITLLVLKRTEQESYSSPQISKIY